MKNILVTGAKGFIGRALVSSLRENGYFVHEFDLCDGDIASAAALDHFLNVPLEFVFHLAARTFVPDSWHEPAAFQRVNVDGTLSVLELCRTRNIHLTYVSAYLYGLPASLPVKESDRIAPNNPYALSKHMAEMWCHFYADHFDVPVTIIRPFNIYGPGQSGHFLIPEIIAQVCAGSPIHVLDLTPRRDYLYLDDLIAGLLCTMSFKAGCRVYNLGAGSSVSVREIIDIIQSVAGTSLEVISEKQSRKNEIPDVYADISKARNELRWHPTISFKDGIARIVQ